MVLFSLRIRLSLSAPRRLRPLLKGPLGFGLLRKGPRDGNDERLVYSQASVLLKLFSLSLISLLEFQIV